MDGYILYIIVLKNKNKVKLPYENTLPDVIRKRGARFDSCCDPRTEKMGRKQRRKAYLRVMEFFGKSV